MHLGHAPAVRFVVEQLDGRRLGVEVRPCKPQPGQQHSKQTLAIRPNSVHIVKGEGMPLPVDAPGVASGAAEPFGNLVVSFDVQGFPSGGAAGG